MKYTFEEIKLTGKKSGICEFCGEKCSRVTTFSQTLNPFNKKEDGSIKTSVDIFAELKAEREAWQSDGIIHHQKCFDLYTPKRQWGKKIVRVSPGKYEYAQ